MTAKPCDRISRGLNHAIDPSNPVAAAFIARTALETIAAPFTLHETDTSTQRETPGLKPGDDS